MRSRKNSRRPSRFHRTGRASTRPLRIERLEERRLLAVNTLFYSGVADFNGTVAGGANLVLGGNQGNQEAGGAHYANMWTTTPGGAAAVGTAVTELGVIPIVGARIDPATGAPQNIPFQTDHNLVAIFAGRSTTIDVSGGNLASSFQRGGNASNPSVLNELVVGIFERSDSDIGGPFGTSLLPTEAMTWINDNNFADGVDLTDGLVGLYRVSLNPQLVATGQDVDRGADGVFEPAELLAVQEERLNLSEATVLAFSIVDNQFKLDRLDLASLGLTPDPASGPAREFIRNFEAEPGVSGLTPVSDSLIANIPQIAQTSLNDEIGTDQIEDFNALFDALLTLAQLPLVDFAPGLAADTFATFDGTGGEFTLLPAGDNDQSIEPGEFGFNGDVVLSNEGGSAYPGQQFIGQATKSGRKYEDLNKDGDDEGGTDPGLAGWTIVAFAEIDTPGILTQDEIDAGPAATAVTGVGGTYTLTLDPGTYIVVEEIPAPPPQWFESPDDDTTAVNPNNLEGFGRYGYAIDLEAGEADTGNDFANYRQATKTGRKYEDQNKDGDDEGGSDPSLDGWTIAAFAEIGVPDGILQAAEIAAGAADMDPTNGVGVYTLTLDPGNYIVVERLDNQVGYFESPDDDATEVNPSGLGGFSHFGYAIVVLSGEVHANNDFANYQKATKSGRKFDDKDGPGPGVVGPGLGGWTIRAYVDANNNNLLDQAEYNGGPAASTTTAAGTGAYTLTLDPGKYIIVEVLQTPTYKQSYPGTGVLAATLVPLGETLGASGYVETLASGQIEPGNDFGNYRQATKTGRKYNDLNADGDDENYNDPGLAGWTIVAFAEIDTPGVLTQAEINAGAAATAVTGVDGSYTMLLDPGAYIVVERVDDHPGYFESPDDDATQVNPNSLGGFGKFGYAIFLEAGAVDNRNDFGNYQTATKEGRKYNDEQADGYSGDGVDDNSDPGLNGWTIAAFTDVDNSGTLTAPDTLKTSDDTSGGGFYSLTGLMPGQQYIIVEQISDQPGWTESPDKDTVFVNTFNPSYGQFGYVVTLESGETEQGNDFGNVEEAGGGEGHTPGFWKSSAKNAETKAKFRDPVTGLPLAWLASGITPDTKLAAVGFVGFPGDKTFIEALNTNGGGVNALFRHAASAYLNAVHPCVDYPIGEPDGQGVVDLVNAALASGGASIEATKDLLDQYNNLGSSLNPFGVCDDDAQAMSQSAEEPEVQSAILTSIGMGVVDATVADSNMESSTISVSSIAGAYLGNSSAQSSSSKSSVAALDVAFDSVAAFRDNLRFAAPLDSDDEDDAAAEALSSADTSAENETLAASLDDVFELLSVA